MKNLFSYLMFGSGIFSLTDKEFKPTVFIPYLIGLLFITIIAGMFWEVLADKIKKWNGRSAKAAY